MRRSGKITLGLLTIGALVGTAYASWTINDKFNKKELEDDSTVVETIDHAEIGKIVVTPKGEKLKFDGAKHGESQLKRTFNITVDKDSVPSDKTIKQIYNPSNYDNFAADYIPNIYVTVEPIDKSTKEVLPETAEFFHYVTKPESIVIDYNTWLATDCGNEVPGQKNPKGYDFTYEFSYKDGINPEDRLNAASDPVKQMEHIIDVLKNVSYKYTFQVGNYGDYAAEETGKVTLPEAKPGSELTIAGLQNGKMPVGLQKMTLSVTDDTLDVKDDTLYVLEKGPEDTEFTRHAVKAVESKVKPAQKVAREFNFNFNFKKGYEYKFEYDLVKFATIALDSSVTTEGLSIEVVKAAEHEGEEAIFNIVYDDVHYRLVEGSVKVNGEAATSKGEKAYAYTLKAGENLVVFEVSKITPTTAKVEQVANGTISFTQQGDVVTLSNEPKPGYKLDHYEVDGTSYPADTKEVKLTAEKENIITGEFVLIPTANLKIDAKFGVETIEQNKATTLTVTIENTGDAEFNDLLLVRNQATNKDKTLKYSNVKLNGQSVEVKAPVNDVDGFDIDLKLAAGAKTTLTADIVASEVRVYKVLVLADQFNSRTIELNVTKAADPEPVPDARLTLTNTLSAPTAEVGKKVTLTVKAENTTETDFVGTLSINFQESNSDKSLKIENIKSSYAAAEITQPTDRDVIFVGLEIKAGTSETITMDLTGTVAKKYQFKTTSDLDTTNTTNFEVITPVEKIDTIVDALAKKTGDALTVRGKVITKYDNKTILMDETGYITIYGYDFYKAAKVGDYLKVKGTKDVYNGLQQVKVEKGYKGEATESFEVKTYTSAPLDEKLIDTLPTTTESFGLVTFTASVESMNAEKYADLIVEGHKAKVNVGGYKKGDLEVGSKYNFTGYVYFSSYKKLNIIYVSSEIAFEPATGIKNINTVKEIANTNTEGLQLTFEILPASANQNLPLTYKIVSGSEFATITETGLLKPISGQTGTVKVVATIAGSAISSDPVTILVKDPNDIAKTETYTTVLNETTVKWDNPNAANKKIILKTPTLFGLTVESTQDSFQQYGIKSSEIRVYGSKSDHSNIHVVGLNNNVFNGMKLHISSKGADANFTIVGATDSTGTEITDLSCITISIVKNDLVVTSTVNLKDINIKYTGNSTKINNLEISYIK